MSNSNSNPIHFVSPRPTVEVHLPDGRVLDGPRNTSVGKFLEPLNGEDEAPIVGAIVNGELRELTFCIKMDAQVTPVRMSDEDGMRIYRRSLVFLLETAFDECFPEAELRVEHSIYSGGYFCRVLNRPPLTAHELALLEEAMRQMAADDLPFTRHETPLSEAMAYFQETGKKDKVRLLSHRRKNYLTLYQLKDFRDYHHGYMLPSTGYLRWFDLVPTEEGFTLHFPQRGSPTRLAPLTEFPKLLSTFRLYSNWLELMGISTVGALNDAIANKRIDELILVAEALHEQRVSEIAAQIVREHERIRVVLIAGPSSSGKTTFSKRLSVQLLASGLTPFPIALDDYFVDREQTPRNEQGELDFEAIDALDRQRLNGDLLRLVSGETVQLPRYNFITGKREQGETVRLRPDDVIILEGIHGLNPALFPQFPVEHTFRVYVSALTQLNLDLHNRISTTDTRLLRRIVRDARERGYAAYQTIQRWESVRRGEKRWIFPFQENADMMFNSALIYELSALKPLVEPLLRQVHYGTPEYVEAKRLMALLDWFLPLESDILPDNSILREFLGNSILRDFTLWHNRSGG